MECGQRHTGSVCFCMDGRIMDIHGTRIVVFHDFASSYRKILLVHLYCIVLASRNCSTFFGSSFGVRNSLLLFFGSSGILSHRRRNQQQQQEIDDSTIFFHERNQSSWLGIPVCLGENKLWSNQSKAEILYDHVGGIAVYDPNKNDLDVA